MVLFNLITTLALPFLTGSKKEPAPAKPAEPAEPADPAPADNTEAAEKTPTAKPAPETIAEIEKLLPHLPALLAALNKNPGAAPVVPQGTAPVDTPQATPPVTHPAAPGGRHLTPK